MANAGAFKKGVKKPNQGKRGPAKITKTVKEVFEKTFRQLQEDPKAAHALHNWAQVEPGEFYKLAAKLIPTELKGEIKHDVLPNVKMVIDEMAKK